MVQRIDDLPQLMTLGRVTLEVASDRLLAVRDEMARKARVFGLGYCGKCLGFSLKREGTLLKCETCLNVVSCL